MVQRTLFAEQEQTHRTKERHVDTGKGRKGQPGTGTSHLHCHCEMKQIASGVLP